MKSKYCQISKLCEYSANVWGTQSIVDNGQQPGCVHLQTELLFAGVNIWNRVDSAVQLDGKPECANMTQLFGADLGHRKCCTKVKFHLDQGGWGFGTWRGAV